MCRFRGCRSTHHVASRELGRLSVALVLFNFVTHCLRPSKDDERGRKQVSACFQSRIQSHGHRRDTRRQRGQDYFRGLRKNKGHTPIVHRLPFDRIGSDGQGNPPRKTTRRRGGRTMGQEHVFLRPPCLTSYSVGVCVCVIVHSLILSQNIITGFSLYLSLSGCLHSLAPSLFSRMPIVQLHSQQAQAVIERSDQKI